MSGSYIPEPMDGSDLLSPVPPEVPPEEPMVEDEVEDEGEVDPPAEPTSLSKREINDLLRDIVDKVEQEESAFRSGNMIMLKKLDNFWHGLQRIYLSSVSKEWVTIDGLLTTDPELYEEFNGTEPVVNIYKAHGEAVISALSQSIPIVKFFPDDADLPQDILAARGYSRIADLIQKHNKAQLLYTQALFTMWNQSFVAAYHYPTQDEKYGIAEIPKTKIEQQTSKVPVCPGCGQDIDQSGTCPSCGPLASEPMMEERTQDIEVPDEPDRIPKSRQTIKIYGPMNVLIQHNASTVEDTGILILYTEQDVAKVRSMYNEVASKIEESLDEEASSRTLAGVLSDLTSVVTLKQVWLRPWMFWRLGDGKRGEIEKLLTMYPDGVYTVIIDDMIFEAHNESLDDRWTISVNPLSRNIHADPLGQTLCSIQETRNDIYALGIETARHGIPETFFDTEILSGTKYSNMEAKPGMLFPIRKRPGQSIADSFHQLKTSTMSKEFESFTHRLDGDAQFLSGASPTIYGGDVGGSQTAKEYETRRAQALQRLQIYWKTLTNWWAELMSKVVIDYASNLLEDEKFVQSKGDSFMNVWIRKDELKSGKIGQIEPDVSDQFPVSMNQKKDLLVQVVQLNNEYLNSVLYHPENATLVANVLGFPEIYVPGDEDRSKQLNEINTILAGGVAEIEPLVDNTMVHIEVTRAWLNSETGQYVKTTNPQGYQMVLMHLQAHVMTVPPPTEPESGGNGEVNNGSNNADSGNPGNKSQQ